MNFLSGIINNNRKIIHYNIPININKDCKLIFIHIPKNAGTSVSKSLGFAKTAHHTAEEIQIILTKNIYEAYDSIAIVRNPYSRFMSLFNYAKQEESLYHSSVNPDKSLYGKHLDYELLKNASLDDCIQLLYKGKLKHDLLWNQWRAQSDWIMNKKEKSLVKKIFKMENLNELQIYLNKKYDLTVEFPKANVSNNTSWEEQNTQHSKELIYNYYKRDFINFGYSF
jgi:chondroitin 4-sulfotransferase 11